MRRTIILFAAVLVLASALNVATALPDIVVDVRAIDSAIRSNESATYVLDIYNNQDQADIISISAPVGGWDVSIPDYILDMKRLSMESTEISISPPADIAPGKYGLLFQFKSTNNPEASTYRYIHTTITESIPVEEPNYIESVDVQTKATEGWLERQYIFKITNTGNVETTRSLTDEISQLDAMLLKSSYEYTIHTVGTNREIEWSYTLAPGESIIIEYSLSYLPIVVSILVLISLLLVYTGYHASIFRLRKSVMIDKQSKVIKVRLSIRNASRQDQKNVVVEDYLPIPLSVVHDFGTMAPNEVSHQKGQTKLIWKFDVLAPKEIREVTYGIRSRMKILGGRISLPQAILTQRVDGKLSKTYSGRAHIRGKRHALDREE